MPDLECHEDRIQKLEQYHAEALAYRKQREQYDLDLKECAEETEQRLQEIADYLATQKGFIGGIIFIVTALGTAVTIFYDKLFR